MVNSSPNRKSNWSKFPSRIKFIFCQSNNVSKSGTIEAMILICFEHMSFMASQWRSRSVLSSSPELHSGAGWVHFILIKDTVVCRLQQAAWPWSWPFSPQTGRIQSSARQSDTSTRNMSLGTSVTASSLCWRLVWVDIASSVVQYDLLCCLDFLILLSNLVIARRIVLTFETVFVSKWQ